MASALLKWLIPGLIVAGGGTALANAWASPPLEAELTSSATAVLSVPELDWSAVRFEGRDAIITGTATTAAVIDEAVSLVAAIPGVRSVTSEVVLAEFVSPFPFTATVEDGQVTLTGGYPSEEVHSVLSASFEGINDQTRLLSGGPHNSDFEAAARFALSAAAALDNGVVSLADLTMTIEGRARSTAAFGDLDALAAMPPPGLKLAQISITPPLVTPYVWTATYDGATLGLSGSVPDAGVEDTLRAAVPSNIPVSTALSLASGEPEAFASKALKIITLLLKLEQGEARIEGDTVTVSGSPATAEIVAEVTEGAEALGGKATLEPPRVADFALTAMRSAGSVKFTGFVPDAAALQLLAAIEGADVSAVALGRGAPERFASGLDFGLSLLARLGEGSMEIKGARVSVGGRAASFADYRELMASLSEGAPQGFSLTVGELRAPVAKPYRFRAEKAEGGAVTLSGYLPDAAARSSLVAALPSVTDTTEIAEGAPDSFAALAGSALKILGIVDSGTLAFDGSEWSIDGTVASPERGLAADVAFEMAGLKDAGWAYDVRLPASQPAASLPTITPYIWGAQKTGQGAISFTGFAPSDGFRRSLLAIAPEAADGTLLGGGAPVDFSETASAGLRALQALDQGALNYDGTRWTLTGQASTTDSRTAAVGELAGLPGSAGWTVQVTVRDSAPLLAPYLWSAVKSSEGSINLSGYLPSESLRDFAVLRAGTVGRDTMSIAVGEPAGFADDMLAGIDALLKLKSGTASFDGARWVLSGEVATQEDGEAAVAALAKGSEGGARWTIAISGYLPPAASAEPSASMEPSSEPAVEPSEPSSAPSSEMSSSEPAEIVSAEPSSEPSSEPVTPSSSEPPRPPVDIASSEPPPSEPPSSEPPASSEEPAPSEPPPAEMPEAPEPPVTPMPTSLVFSAAKTEGGPVTLTGDVPDAATAKSLAALADTKPEPPLKARLGLPGDFAASATTGIDALRRLESGQLGFDGVRWYLRGEAESVALRDMLKAQIAALPRGDFWSVGVTVLPSLEVCRSRVAELAGRNAITFNSGAATLTSASAPVVDELALDLAICPETSVYVEGHTDADGAEDLNLVLSVARAEAVVNALIERGVGVDRLYAVGYGESQPIASNETRDGKAANRRIAFQIVED